MNERFRLPSFVEEDLAERGFSIPSLLRHAALPEDFFRRDKVYATTSQFFALWRAIGQLSPDPAIGITIASDERMERYLPTAIAAICSSSLHDALQRMARYKRLTCPEDIRIRLARDEASVESIFLESDDDQPDALVDLTMSCIYSVARRGTGGTVTPIRLELTRTVQHRRLLEAFFRCPVTFQTQRNALVFRRRDLSLPFVSRNTEVLEAVTAQLDADLNVRTADADLRSTVTHSLRRALAGQSPSLRMAAKQVGMSVRTLQRRMQSNGFTFKQIAEETRHEMALHHLKGGTTELSEIAFLLGYGNAISFFRAFRRWEGVSPGEWRRRHRAQPRDVN